MAKFHVNQKTGMTGVCEAQEGNCPLGGDSGSEHHYETEMEAVKAAEKIMEEEYGIVSINSRKDRDRYVLPDEPKYKNIGGFMPTTHGSRVRIKGNEYTIINNKINPILLIADDGTDFTDEYAKLLKGSLVKYDLVSGPATDEFRHDVRIIESYQQLYEARNKIYLDNIKLDLEIAGEDENVSWYRIKGSNASQYNKSGMVEDDDSVIRFVVENNEGEAEYTIDVLPDGKTFHKNDARYGTQESASVKGLKNRISSFKGWKKLNENRKREQYEVKQYKEILKSAERFNK